MPKYPWESETEKAAAEHQLVTSAIIPGREIFEL